MTTFERRLCFVFRYAGEVLPNLGRAMSPENFAPYFAGLFQVIIVIIKIKAFTAEEKGPPCI